GRAVVAVLLNGRGPYRFAVETGSPDVMLTSATVAALSLPASGGARFRLDSLRIGDALIRGLLVGRHDAIARLGVDGVLGLDAYRDLLLTVDYPGSRLVLSRGSLPEPDGGEILRAVRVGPFLGVELDVGGVREVGVIDTQGGVGFQALPEVAAHFRFQEDLAVVGRAIVGGNPPVEVRRGRLAGEMRVGRHRFASPGIDVHELPPDIPSRMTIGVRVLRHFVLTLDQRAMLVRLSRPGTDPVPVG
ncbi:MAG TPA: hypothetical protein VFZ26_15945, partial [Gemmatimonadales bacterium]